MSQSEQQRPRNEFEEFRMSMGKYELNVVTYPLGDDYVCVISNLDPGTTLARTIQPTRNEAIQDCVQTVKEKIAASEKQIRTPVATVQIDDRPISRIELVDDEGHPHRLTLHELFTLPGDRLMMSVITNSLHFFDDNDEPIECNRAITILRDTKARQRVLAYSVSD